MKRLSPAAGIAASARTVAGSLESRVGGSGTFLPIIEQNTRQIFEQVDKIEFT
jgi:hypothetical protein